MTKERST